MSGYYRRTKPKPQDEVKAGLLAAGLAVGVAAVSYYLMRLFLAREEMGLTPLSAEDDGKDLDPSEDPA